MILLAVLFVMNAGFAASPPYGWLTVLNAAAAIGALVMMALVARDG